MENIEKTIEKDLETKEAKGFFKDEQEEMDHLEIENDAVIVAKYDKDSKSNINVIYDKESETAYAAYEKMAMLKLKAQDLEEACREIRHRQLEFLAELIAFNTYVITKEYNKKEEE